MFFKRLIYALRFMTALPLPWRENEDLIQVSRSSGFFPMVGLIIGVFLWGCGRLFGLFLLSPLTIAVLQTALWVLMTGGLHLDGLADTFDGIGSRRDRERMLEIMKDSHIGAFGVLALILQLLLKTILCYELLLSNGSLIILAPLLARWGQLIGIRFFPPARKDGMGKFFQEHMTWKELLLGLLTSLFVIAAYQEPFWLLLLPLHTLFAYLLSLRISKILGGLTGDVYGLICETGETFLLLALIIFVNIL